MGKPCNTAVLLDNEPRLAGEDTQPALWQNGAERLKGISW
jgi:hypothetical protein